MKTEFTESNLRIGTFIIKNNVSNPIMDVGFASTMAFKVVFVVGQYEKQYGLCNFLTDGWVSLQAKTIGELAEQLNNDEYGYRYMTKDEVIQIIKSRTQGFSR